MTRMTNVINGTLVLVFPCIASLMLYGVLYEGLTFGYGLGDVFYVGFYTLGIAGFMVISFIYRKNLKQISYINIFWFLFILFLFLQLTFFKELEIRKL